MGLYYNIKKSMLREIVSLSLQYLPDTVGTSFPASPNTGHTAYRTDLEKLFYFSVTWQELPLDYFFFDLDSHAEEQEIPDNSLLTIKGFTISLDEHIISVDCLIGVMIKDDTNLVKHDEVLDKLFTRFLPTKEVELFDMTSGEKVGIATSLGNLEVSPMFKSNLRPLQFLTVSFLTDLTADWTVQ